MKRQITIYLTLLPGLLFAAAVSAATYKWTDEQGNVHYTQHPPRDTEYERMKVDKSRPSPADTLIEQTNQAAPKPSSSADTSKLIKEEVAKNQEIREKNCTAAKKNLEIFTVFKRYKDKEGNVVRMDDKERATKIEEAKQNIAEFCD